MAPLNVLISGGGIAGPALAFWLARSQLPATITIVERSPALRVAGQQVDLRGQGVNVMRRMGIEDAVCANLVHEPGMRLLDARGRSYAYFPAATAAGEGHQSITSEFEIVRGDLVRILYQVTRGLEGVRYVFGTQVEELNEDESSGKVHVKFSDGKAEDFDLVVGADGQGSKIRKILLGQTDVEGDEDKTFKSLASYLAYYTIPHDPKDTLDTHSLRVAHFPGGRAVFTRQQKQFPGVLRVYLMIHGPEGSLPELYEAHRSGDVAAQKAAWAKLFVDAGWQCERFVDGMLKQNIDNDFYSQILGQVRMDNWVQGHVALLGDAGYCPSPLTGHGTSVALVGAYVLVGELARACAKVDGEKLGSVIPEALKTHEEKLRPFLKGVHDLPPGAPGIALPQTVWGVWFLQRFLGLMAFLRIDKLTSWIGAEDKGGWKAPDYPELGSIENM